ncbi:MAG: VIT1/CCC1 transporter family protein [Vulcanimicrobiaceae bacterium]
MSTHALDHSEHHRRSSDMVRDVVLGLADGLTVPFALAAGVSSAGASSAIIVTAGAAEIAAGAIAMGIGGYLAARSDVEHYESEYRREVEETHMMPAEERAEVADVFARFGVAGDLLDQLVDRIASDRTRWVDFMMRFELGLERPDRRRAPVSAATIGASYVAGGVIPLAPYVVLHDIASALLWSIGLTLTALLIFGAAKARINEVNPWVGAAQTALTGGIAAAVAFSLAKLVAR